MCKKTWQFKGMVMLEEVTLDMAERKKGNAIRYWGLLTEGSVRGAGLLRSRRPRPCPRPLRLGE